MDRLLFQLKHAHLAALRMWRPWTLERDLTPARLDLLRVVQRSPGETITQTELWKELNVTKPVVSLMARALESLGFLTRTRHDEDRRTFLLRLTEKAKRALRALYHEAIHIGFLTHALACVLEPPQPRKGWRERKYEIEWRLQRIRNRYGIGITSSRPWEPEEDDEGFWYAEVPDNPNVLERSQPYEEDDEAPFDDGESAERAGFEPAVGF